MVEDATGTDEVLEYRRGEKEVGRTSSLNVKQISEKVFESDDDSEDKLDCNEEDIIFTYQDD